jgi:predicted transcriptional regulator
MRVPFRRGPKASASAGLPILGELESTVLEYLWDRGEADVKDVHRDIGAARGITVSTIQSTLERLHRKNLARRERVSHAYRYEPALTRHDFQARAVAVAAGELKGAAASGVLAAFVDLAAKADHANLDRLEALVKKARAGASQRGGR